ncbi:uncharacterized protein LOC104888801 isoform X1 [Beta vulgaris subsp. vulgaris]|uniref:uncharacterized protein LOC104888801 isoform X1 n=2 Tax=Beta vulgaris subsp. vulgaris TaxID=3555 RepID=UPI002036A53B|nr:uncharacterized protein LOC104888801 isoform X1 [Beta vulgaris subsp. vulgaris]XP_010672187.3 uncharacterized protein LOC104888801 isoform X1 [Beta vulgaris subsp. vulgaris]XP_048497066.1 uncharacterized protein LOC104888801 isoform X1 [Beta vulgaris subsp. vulgaris]
MATSLILYLEKKNLNSRAKRVGTRSDLFASGATELQTVVRMKSTDDQIKDRGRMGSHAGSGINQRHNHRDSRQNDLLNCKGSASFNKASEDVDIITQLHRESNSGAGILENTFSSVVSSPLVTPSPTFTFDVCCEDGIQLYVDLNSSPSDWIESLKAGVHISHDVHKPNSQSFHQDIGLLCCSKKKNGSFTMDPSKETETGQLELEYYPTTMLTDNQAQMDKPDGGEGSLSSPELKSLGNDVHDLENLREDQTNLLSRLESGIEGQLPGSKSSGREETMVAVADVNAAVEIRAYDNSAGNFLPSEHKCSAMPAQQNDSAGNEICIMPSTRQNYGSVDPVLKCSDSSTTVYTEMQASTGKCVDMAEKVKNSEVVQHGLVESAPSMDELQMRSAQAFDQNKCPSSVFNSLSPGVADNRCQVDTEQSRAPLSDGQVREAKKYSAENAGFLSAQEAGNETDELMEEDAALYTCCSNRSVDLVVPKQNGADYCISSKTNDLKEDDSISLSTANVGNLGKSNIKNGSEESECLNIKNLKEKPWKKPVDSESNGEHKRKRHLNSVDQSKFFNTEAKILRSSKQFAGDLHSKRRRSSRLFSKVSFICCRDTHIQRKNNGAYILHIFNYL